MNYKNTVIGGADKKRILFVCTGNTCRSPMAQAIFNSKAKELQLPFEAFSRGLYADGSKISKNAQKALSEYGIEPLEQISETVSERDISEAYLVIGISVRHTQSLISAFYGYRDKIIPFPLDIKDPYGGDINIYRAVLCEIEKGIDVVIDKLQKSFTNVGEEIVIERLSKEHIDGVATVENECFSEPWSKNAIEGLLESSYAVYFVAKNVKDSRVIGYCGMYVSGDTGSINNIGVLPEYRHCGTGTGLLRELIRYSKDNDISLLTLEVRESNSAAIALYEKHGFLKVGTRKNYYRKPAENAILYNLQLSCRI